MTNIRKKLLAVVFLATLIGLLLSLSGSALATATPGDALWAKSTAAGAPENSYFYGVSVDPSGNTYAVGYIYGTGSFDFGNGVTVAGGNADRNTVIVKYDSTGAAQWARSTAAGAPDYSGFSGVSVDPSGNAYAVGEITFSTGSYDFGNGVTVAGGYDGNNTVIVKYAGEPVVPPVAPVNPELPFTGGQPASLASTGQLLWVLPAVTAGLALVFLGAALLRGRARI